MDEVTQKVVDGTAWREFCDLLADAGASVLARNTAIMARIAYLHERTGQPAIFLFGANPILGILRRRIAAEGRQ